MVWRAPNQIDARLTTLFVHQAQLQHGGHVQRRHEALESHLQVALAEWPLSSTRASISFEDLR